MWFFYGYPSLKQQSLLMKPVRLMFVAAMNPCAFIDTNSMKLACIFIQKFVLMSANTNVLRSAANYLDLRYRVSNRTVSAKTLFVHTGQHPDLRIDIVVYANFGLAIVQTVDAACILG